MRIKEAKGKRIMLKDYIVKRKSTRKFDMKPLEEDVLHEIKEFATTMKPLYEHIKVEYSFLGENEVKNILPVKAPHYIIISSESTEGYLTNVGFLLQQMDLYVSSKGLGSCYLGLAKPTEKADSELEFVIILAFGNSLDSPYREESEFKRKPLTKISNREDQRLEVVRLAPSSTNSQPWYVVSIGDVMHLYCVKLGLFKGMMYNKMNQIDMGIALAHLYVSHTSTFSYFSEQNPPVVEGYYYIGSALIN
ncbi:MAG: nitroreductase [Spirochaetia bacterium]|nr:nitroreductase [Spirochaetia bacterium]